MEEFDEFEEWTIKCSHYCIVVATKTDNKLLFTESFDPLLKLIPNESVVPPTYCGLPPLHNTIEKCDFILDFQQPKFTGRTSPLKRWAHSAVHFSWDLPNKNAHSDVIIVFGGFGGDAKQQRLNDLWLLDCNTLAVRNPSTETSLNAKI